MADSEIEKSLDRSLEALERCDRIASMRQRRKLKNDRADLYYMMEI